MKYWKGKKLSKKHKRNISKGHQGLKLGPQSPAHKNAISISKVGFLRTPEQRKEAKRKNCRKANRKLKERLCAIYGRKCSNPKCRWKNEDGSFRCDNIDILQLDHKKGGGAKARKGKSSFFIYRNALKEANKNKYQMLCPNCNWLKRIERKEFRQ